MIELVQSIKTWEQGAVVALLAICATIVVYRWIKHLNGE